MKEKPYESSNNWQKLKLVQRLWRNSMRKANRNYQRTFFKLGIKIYHCNNEKGMNILKWPVN